MKPVVIAVVVLGAFTATRATTLYPFDIYSTLNCYRETKTDVGTVAIVKEEPPRLRYGRRVNQSFAEEGIRRVFLPEDTTFSQPQFQLTRELEEILLDFLNLTENPATALLTSVYRPNRDAPRACEFLPAFIGSAGQTKKHVEVIEERFPLEKLGSRSDSFASSVNPSVFTNVAVPADPTFPDDPSFIDNDDPAFFRGFRFLGDDQGQGSPRRYQNFINEIEQMCELWIAKCPLVPVWAELPDTFFPRYIAQGTCSGKDCSYPRGLHCEEDLVYTVYVTVLRWDCCYSAKLAKLRWDCGWRKVQVPLLCECTCACGPVLSTNIQTG